MFKGSMVAIVTPFDAQGRFDEETYRRLIEFQLENGTDAIIPCGTTGESSTLDYEEHNRVIQVCIDQVKKRVPVIAGTGSNSTAEAIEMSLHARKMGADAVLLVSPYYNKPTQEGLYAHYKAIHDALPLPQILYNVPGRTGMNLEAKTTIRLAELANVVAIKEASGSVTQASEIIAAAADKIDVLSGDDFLTLPLMVCGAVGVISVTANIAPKQVKAMVAAVNAGNWAEAKRLHLDLLDLHQAMFIESNPVPVKTSLALMGKIQANVRLPLVGLQPATLEKLTAVLKKHKLI
jgi:4-hydroxy-tetrahydrodipicolinate synthase